MRNVRNESTVYALRLLLLRVLQPPRDPVEAELLYGPRNVDRLQRDRALVVVALSLLQRVVDHVMDENCCRLADGGLQLARGFAVPARYAGECALREKEVTVHPRTKGFAHSLSERTREF